MRGYSLTETVRSALATARDEAAALHHAYVGAEHILLALTVSEDRALLELWSALGLNPNELRKELVASISPGSGAPPGPDLPYTRAAKGVLEFAMREAAAFEDSTVEPSHLLLGEAGQGEELPAKLLKERGATLERIRAEIAGLRGRGLPERVESIDVIVRMRNGSVVERRFEAGHDDVLQFLFPFLNLL
jgi:ATP-dependent Clp protease ATP-binding subunit ClpC